MRTKAKLEAERLPMVPGLGDEENNVQNATAVTVF
jgi:hypothetical protein